MSSTTYLRFEVLRTVRNRRFFIFSLIFPFILYIIVAGSNRHVHIDGITFPVYYMTGMIAWGAMSASIGGGARIALERSVGWTRQIRITPLSRVGYFGAKVLTGYLMAACSILLLSLAGVALGVRLSAGGWVEMVVLVLLGLIPFIVLGIVVGHVVGSDAIGPVLGGGTSLLALLGGAFGPLASGGAFHQISMLFPSYWLVQAGKVALTHHGWSTEGWIVLVVWTAVLTRLAVFVYRRELTGGPR